MQDHARPGTNAVRIAPSVFATAAPRWLTALAVGFVLTLLWWRTERFIPDDAYFYLVVARNLARSGVQTFSGIFDTDGVHPLWTWVAAAATWAMDLVNSHWAASPRTFLVVHHAALAGSAWALASTARKLGLSPWLVAAVPVAFVASVPVLHSEAPVSLLALALLGRAFVTPAQSTGAGVTVGLAAALAVFARLDHAFVAVAVLGAWHGKTHTRRSTVAAWLAAALPVGAWLVWHRMAFGGWVPVSGALKSTWPSVCPTGLTVYGITSAFSGWNLVFGWLPLVAMGAALMRTRGTPSEARTLVGALAGGSTLHALQVALFTFHPASWLWYYVAPVVGATWALALVLQGRPVAARWLTVGCVSAAANYAGWVAVRPWQATEGARVVAWLEAHGIRDATLLVSDSPGEIAYRTTNRVIALDLLTSNPRLAAAVHNAADPMAPIFDVARAAGQPVTYVLHTTATWLTGTRISENATALDLRFLRAGMCRGRTVARLVLGAPIVRQPELTVWRVGDKASQ